MPPDRGAGIASVGSSDGAGCGSTAKNLMRLLEAARDAVAKGKMPCMAGSEDSARDPGRQPCPSEGHMVLLVA